ncbi:MAG: hypothetical protein HQM08_24190 [Candidatus Riflebacteria bacterium]|nr:hypothetical protein [Candidatus Riflebacteria bacterium]
MKTYFEAIEYDDFQRDFNRSSFASTSQLISPKFVSVTESMSKTISELKNILKKTDEARGGYAVKLIDEDINGKSGNDDSLLQSLWNVVSRVRSEIGRMKMVFEDREYFVREKMVLSNLGESISEFPAIIDKVVSLAIPYAREDAKFGTSEYSEEAFKSAKQQYLTALEIANQTLDRMEIDLKRAK